MSKLFVFGIGGTGSRVLYSLTMLLAAGVKCNRTIVPIIIDPDHANANYTKTSSLIRNYQSVHQASRGTSDSKNTFFNTPIESAKNIQNSALALSNTNNVLFKDYMGCGSMTTENKALINLLFSEDNLNASMEVGFKGNPNIGTVVLNQFANNDDFISFCNDFQDGDSIFIISSIFGGTGASGFPLLLKNLRNNNKVPNFAIINQAPIGAISVLPYFKVQPDSSSAVDSATFISKTQAALRYYQKNINNGQVDTMYYIGDTVSKTYDNCEGGSGQDNDAHAIELFSALAIIDFAQDPQRNAQTVEKEFGIDPDDTLQGGHVISFRELGRETLSQIQKPLMQFALMSRYLDHVGTLSARARMAWVEDNEFQNGIGTGETDFNHIRAGFVEWQQQMADNNIALKLFDYSNPDLALMPQGIEPIRKGVFHKRHASIKYDEDIDTQLNKASKKIIKSNSAKMHRFLELFSVATNDVINEKYGI